MHAEVEREGREGLPALGVVEERHEPGAAEHVLVSRRDQRRPRCDRTVDDGLEPLSLDDAPSLVDDAAVADELLPGRPADGALRGEGEDDERVAVGGVELLERRAHRVYRPRSYRLLQRAAMQRGERRYAGGVKTFA